MQTAKHMSGKSYSLLTNHVEHKVLSSIPSKSSFFVTRIKATSDK